MENYISTTDVIAWLRHNETNDEREIELKDITTTSGYIPEVVVMYIANGSFLTNNLPILRELGIYSNIIELVINNAVKLTSNWYRKVFRIIDFRRFVRAIILEACEEQERWYSYVELREIYRNIYYLYTQVFKQLEKIVFDTFRDSKYFCLKTEYNIDGRITFYYIRRTV